MILKVIEQNFYINYLLLLSFQRAYGEKVAEIPLVATQFQHRRLGMCRILFNELEKVCISSSVQFCGVEVYQRNKRGPRVYSFSCREVYDSLAADSRFLGYVFRLVTMVSDPNEGLLKYIL
uniref:Putative ovule protein n=1 Tax=Solanum chacoense TaxID=4108 RepID=A0A0V0HB07_SOLCH